MTEKNTNTGVMLFFALVLALLCVPAARAQGTAEATFKAKCAGCHGADGSANTPAAKALGFAISILPTCRKRRTPNSRTLLPRAKTKCPSMPTN